VGEKGGGKVGTGGAGGIGAGIRKKGEMNPLVTPRGVRIPRRRGDEEMGGEGKPRNHS